MSQNPQQDTTDIEDRCKVCHKPRGRYEDARDEVRTSGRAGMWLKNTVAGAEAGCEFCSLLVSVVARARGQNHNQYTPENKTFLSFIFRDASLKVELRRTENEIGSRSFKIYTTAEVCPWLGFKPSRVTSGFSGSPERLSLIGRWTNECFKSHTECHQDNNITLPTRVIDLGDSSACIPKLKSGRGISGRYCALSHCWGGGSVQPIRTLKNNISQMESGITMVLSKTFQDAITITRSLSVRYLWIDSLCIIQDNEHDWEIESSQMASIYENAYLVISAAHASDGSKGCFSNQWGPGNEDKPIYEYKMLDGSIVPFYLRIDSQISHYEYDPALASIERLDSRRAPLHTRSWALQERILSTRIVHFTGQELVWECRTISTCECRQLEYLPHSRSPIKQQWAQRLSRRHELGHNWYDVWHSLVRLYGRLTITFPSDRLPALSGLAMKFQGAGAGNYAAGLWIENILADLLWMTKDPVERPPSWLAPSWSWASLQLESNSPISHSVSEETYGRTLPLDTRNLVLESGGRMETTLVDVRCEASGEDPTGRVRPGASLTISAPIISVSLAKPPTLGEEGFLSKYGALVEFVADTMTDFADLCDDGNTLNLYCVWIGTTQEGERMTLQTIVLRESKGVGGVAATPGAYERVGLMHTWWYRNVDKYDEAKMILEWFREAEVKVVKIV